jgi:hypothetical protein
VRTTSYMPRDIWDPGEGPRARWCTTCSQLELAREAMDTRTNAIMHLENAIEMQDVELDERVEQIAALDSGATRTRGGPRRG